MPLIKAAEFDKSIIPSDYKKDVRNVIELAAMMGWTIHKTTQDSISIIAPHGPGEEPRKRFHFGHVGRSSIPVRRIEKDVIKFADPRCLTIAKAAVDDPNVEAGNVMIEALPHVDEMTVEELPGSESEPEPRRIVSQLPMIARGGEKSGYTSETTIVRKWSDGTTDYACAFEGCDFVSQIRKGPSGHYATTHNRDKGTTPLPPRFPANVTDATSYAPRQTRVEALTQVIRDMIAAGNESPELIARQVLVWVHQQTKHRTEFSEDVDLSADDMLERIRHMLDRGQYAAAQRRQEELAARVEALESEVDEARKQAKDARENLRTFVALARELEGEQS